MKLPSTFIEGSDALNALIETPKGSRNKYVYDEDTGGFKLKKALPAGMVFPFDFGFIPYTIAEDGDPLDILVLTDAPTFPGCIIEVNIIGIIKVQQEKKGKNFRNDRVIGVQVDSRLYGSVEKLADLEDGLLKEIIHFFASYNQVSEDQFIPLGNDGSKEALRIIRESIKKAEEVA
ncbi:MAG: Inorganic diphosphatase [Segetibacter sp.]|nr:Inorganic diphosphatase [Segetibacter sp.]